MAESTLSEKQRAEVLEELTRVVPKRFYDPEMRGIDWTEAVARHRDNIVGAQTDEEFEKSVTSLLSELKSSHVGFYHRSLARATGKMAISATYAAFPFEGQERWVFQDVHLGGAAANADIHPGDILLSVDGRPFHPPEHPIFPMGRTVSTDVITKGLRPATRKMIVPEPTRKRNQLPHAQPTLVCPKRLNHNTGYVKISMFPGLVGIEVANSISSGIEGLKPIERLIIDLRGNTGGGLGVLRVMSLLTPKRLPVGYSIKRDQVGRVHPQNRLPVFDRIPTHKSGLYPLVLRFGWRWKPILLATEGLEEQPFHNRVVLLVDRHTASASEMLVAFARESGLATLVGEATPGRILSGSKFKLPYGYWIALPVGAYHTAGGSVLEGTPIVPDVEAPFDPELAREGRDPQLERAVEVVSQL